MGRRVFFDCGAHYGEGLREFARRLGMDQRWVVHCFEPNPECHWYFEGQPELPVGPTVHFHKAAVWTSDGTVGLRQENHRESLTGSPVFGSSPIDGWGSTVVGESRHPALQAAVEVPCVDLGRMVLEETNESDLVVIKLDVEGAEYAILRKMIEDRSLARVAELYVEFHWRFLPSESAESTERLKQQVLDAFPRLRFHDWG